MENRRQGCEGGSLGCGVLQYQLQMQAEEAVKFSSKFSNRSRQSQPSSCRSLERNSWSSRDHSLTKNHCLVEVMSLEGSKKSDLYQKILAEGVPTPLKSKPSKNDFNPFRTCFKVESKPEQRFSYEEQEDISHICLCYLTCKAETCPCALNLEEDCSDSFCCKECIESKRIRRAEAQMLSEGEPDPMELTKISCTCKRTKCNKKYCSCFAAGVKCGRDCTCEDCANCERQASMEIEPVCIVDEEIRQMPMPESMDFEPFQFRYSYNN